MPRADQATAKRFRSSCTPLGGGEPRGLKRRPEPATRSFKVLETRISSGDVALGEDAAHPDIPIDLIVPTVYLTRILGSTRRSPMKHSQRIVLARLANNSSSEVQSMVRELEGRDREERSANLHWPTRFISAGVKPAPPRWPSRFISAGTKTAPNRA